METTGQTMVTPGAIYSKTAKGTDEVSNRTFKLAPRTRQLLIMIDGRRDSMSLLALFPPDLGSAMLAQLVDGGFVQEVALPGAQSAPVQSAPAPAAAPAPAQGAGASSAPAPLAGADDEDPFVLGQTFMINLAKRILGIAGDPIVARLRAAHDIGDLRGLYLDWRSAIKQAPDGLLRLKELEKKLAKVLGDLPTA